MLDPNQTSNSENSLPLPTLQERIELRLKNVLSYLRTKRLDADIEILDEELSSLLGKTELE